MSAFKLYFYMDADLDFLHKILFSLASGNYISQISQGPGYGLAEVVARVPSQTDSGGRDRNIHFKAAIKRSEFDGNTPEAIDLSIGDSIDPLSG